MGVGGCVGDWEGDGAFFLGGSKVLLKLSTFWRLKSKSKNSKKKTIFLTCYFLKKKVRNFLVEKLPIFSFRHILKDVFKTLLWGPETVRKKYRVGLEIFPKRLSVRARLGTVRARLGTVRARLATVRGRLGHSTCKTSASHRSITISR